MSALANALVVLRPLAEWASADGTYDGLIWLDKTQAKPSRDEVAAEIARQQASANRIVVERLYFFLGLEAAGLDQKVEDLCAALKQAGNRKPAIYLRDAKEFESDHELVLQLGQHPSIGLTPQGIHDLFVAMAAAQAARAA